ncbi:bifunctional tetrahydrofolate synthase/dihydrofolate synthase [Candidatus Thiothrix anitrata]|uniref:Dihydrofolate synthase/folylpolyglutamate synthase n=1 Tax=Candidatus Thiothrix anitrata TaxID=2823902 RepID=A0ABX7X8V3_9GAMM|nr:bifunctional tetrahydrofolate synthase/dihydrofolate synthase [Candidatus Thiothrix anitrata]QTR51670.1 bifunctional tetrahydrofolate synthase/dihydrofolate synthase [Candidatus Thiothrix anitrata]
MNTLDDWLRWQENQFSTEIRLGLERIRSVAERMQLLSLPVPVITVGGTNGKGSTCAMLTRILQLQGYRVGTYTSPHLLRYNERIALDGAPVSDQQICAAFSAIDQARDEIDLTYFEFGTLAAAWCFVQAKVDVMVLEVGLGGRLDACNLWDADVTIITSIGLDHVDWLGHTREAIGLEKSGIMRPGKPVVCGDPDPPSTIASHAAQVGARLLQYGRDFNADNVPQPVLLGEVQRLNAACVVTALQQLQVCLPVSEQAIAEGLRTVSLAGRLQQFAGQPTVILDVAHNPHAATQLADWLKKNPIAGKTSAIFSILADKDIAGVVKIMAAHMDEWHLVPLGGYRAISPTDLSSKIRAAGVRKVIYFHDDFSSAWQFIQSHASKQDRVVAFGSFLVVSGMLNVLAKRESQ